MAEEIKKDTSTFEGAIARLEEIVKLLESGNAPLDGSLALFEEGTALVKQCNAQLDNAERKIRMLTKNQDGEYGTQDFGTDKE